MIGYGEKQAVLYHGDHKPAEIYGPKMVKTTGAQLLDLENVIIQRGTKKLETWGVISSFTDYYFTYFYLTKEVLTYLNSHIQNGLTFSMDRNTTGRNIAIVFCGVKDGQNILDEKNSNESFVTLTPHDVDTVTSVELRLNRSSTRIDVDGDEFDYLMVNEGLEPLPWEPFSHMIPSEVSIGTVKYAGWKETEMSGQEIALADTYDDRLGLTLYGHHQQYKQAEETVTFSGNTVNLLPESNSYVRSIVYEGRHSQKSQKEEAEQFEGQEYSFTGCTDSYLKSVVVRGQHSQETGYVAKIAPLLIGAEEYTTHSSYNLNKIFPKVRYEKDHVYYVNAEARETDGKDFTFCSIGWWMGTTSYYRRQVIYHNERVHFIFRPTDSFYGNFTPESGMEYNFIFQYIGNEVAGNTAKTEYRKMLLLDLTEMFGAGKEPTSVTALEEMLPESIYTHGTALFHPVPIETSYPFPAPYYPSKTTVISKEAMVLRGKNLFDINDFKQAANTKGNANSYIRTQGEYLRFPSWYGQSGGCGILIPVTPGKSYTISFEKVSGGEYYTEPQVYTDVRDGYSVDLTTRRLAQIRNGVTQVVTIPEGFYWLSYCIDNFASPYDCEFRNFMIEENNAVTAYEPFIKTQSLECDLKLYGDEKIWDSLDFVSGKVRRRWGVCAIRDLSWSYHSSWNAFIAEITDMKELTNTYQEIPKIQCSCYRTTSYITKQDKTIYGWANGGPSAVFISDKDFDADVNAFLDAVGNEFIYYILAAEKTETVATSGFPLEHFVDRKGIVATVPAVLGERVITPQIPGPLFPSEVEPVKKEQCVIRGVNLYAGTDLPMKSYCQYSPELADGLRTLKQGEKYFVSWSLSSGTELGGMNALLIFLKDGSRVWGATNGIPYAMQQDGDNIENVLIYGTNQSSDYLIQNIMLAKSDVPVPYEAYEGAIGKSADVILYGDELVKDSFDMVSGKIIRRWGKLILTGKEAISYADTLNWATIRTGVLTSDRESALCSHLINAVGTVQKDNFWWDSSLEYLRMNIGSFSSAEDYQFFLRNQYENGTPVTVYYRLASEGNEQGVITNISLEQFSDKKTVIELLPSADGIVVQRPKMPSIKFPSGIVPLSKEEALITGKNLFNPYGEINFSLYSYHSSDGMGKNRADENGNLLVWNGSNGYLYGQQWKGLPAGTYTASFDVLDKGDAKGSIYAGLTKNGKFADYNTHGGLGHHVYRVTVTEGDWVCLFFGIGGATMSVKERPVVFSNIQLEKSDSETGHLPFYEAQSLIEEYELYGRDGVYDTIEPCVLVDGEYKCRITRRWYKFVATGSEGWVGTKPSYDQPDGVDRRLVPTVPPRHNDELSSSNSLDYWFINWATSARSENTFCTNSDQVHIKLGWDLLEGVEYDKTGEHFSDVTMAFKEYLRKRYEAGDPIYIVYRRKTESVELYEPIPLRTVPYWTIIRGNTEMTARAKVVERDV